MRNVGCSLFYDLILLVSLLSILFLGVSKASECKRYESNPYKVAYTIVVDKSGRGKFTSVQSAIDSIPEGNTEWIRIQISPGVYEEKILIPYNKPCIFLHGAGSKYTSIEYDDHKEEPNGAIFLSQADNVVAKGITFMNTYNIKPRSKKFTWLRATAAKIQGDKCAFFHCAFVGLQDTLYDSNGRHYYHKTYIEGAIDFIFGEGQTIYDKCNINMNMGRYDKGGLHGSITAQKKSGPNEASGYVFKDCNFFGTGKAILGRAWGPYSTVIIYGSTISDIIDPSGWNAWRYKQHEQNIMYVEADNTGPGANTSNRVSWMKKLDASALKRYTDISYINSDGWIEKLPTH